MDLSMGARSLVPLKSKTSGTVIKGSWLTTSALAAVLALTTAVLPSHVLAQSGVLSGDTGLTTKESYYSDQIDVSGCPHPVAIRLPEPFLPVSKSMTLTNFLNEQLPNQTFSAVYQSSFYVHEQWAVPSTVSVGIMNRNEEMQGSFTVNDFQSINNRVKEGLIERSAKVRNYLGYIEKTRPTELAAAQYMFGNTFYLNPEHFVYYDVSTVNVGGIYNIQKLNAANFIYVNGCILFASVEVIDNLTSFHEFHAMNAQLSAGMPQPSTPRFGFSDRPGQ
tara:strand:+ start:4328 stop:5158 length:831 start_codon:yes stop_codon:yes gene_type:complete